MLILSRFVEQNLDNYLVKLLAQLVSDVWHVFA